MNFSLIQKSTGAPVEMGAPGRKLMKRVRTC